MPKALTFDEMRPRLRTSYVDRNTVITLDGVQIGLLGAGQAVGSQGGQLLAERRHRGHADRALALHAVEVLREVQEEVSTGGNGRRSRQAVARGREDQRGQLPDAVQG